MSREKELLEEYAQAKSESDKFQEKAKIAKQRLEAAEFNLTQFMTDSEIKSTAKYDGIGHATLTTPKLRYCNYDKNKEHELFNFIHEQGEGDLIKTQINPTSFRAFVGRMIKSGTPLPNYLDYEVKDCVRFFKKQ
jgi:hypothetical protein